MAFLMECWVDGLNLSKPMEKLPAGIGSVVLLCKGCRKNNLNRPGGKLISHPVIFNGSAKICRPSQKPSGLPSLSCRRFASTSEQAQEDPWMARVGLKLGSGIPGAAV
jgi:hypothetical protein